MKICPECNKNEYDDTKYLFCFDCAKKEKEKREQEKAASFKGIPDLIDAINGLVKVIKDCSAAEVRAIEAVNNNEYANRVIGEYFLSKENKKLIWNKKKANKKGDFEIVGLNA